MPIARNGSNAAAKGPAVNFTGNVRVETPFAALAPGRVAGAIVTFEPGARSAWHTHPPGKSSSSLPVSVGRSNRTGRSK